MYQFKIRPKFGPALTAQHKTRQINRNPSASSATLLDSSNLRKTIYYKLSLALVTGCFFAFLSGCGGMTLNSTSLTKGSTSASTTVALSSISCGTQSLTGPQSKECSAYLSAPATSATTVSLTSSNAALNVSASVVVPAGAKSGGFKVVSGAVNTSLSVTITGKTGSVAKTDVITLYPAPASSATTPTLSKVSCGAQTVTGATTKACSVYLSAAATSQTVVTLSSNNSALKVPASVTVPAGATTGGFGVSTTAVSTTQTATLTASADGVTETDAIQLEGTGPSGSAQHRVQLSWSAPTGTSDTIVGYMVYRASGSSSYALLTSSMDTQTTFADTTVQSGLTYDYTVKSVDSKGMQSAPSNATVVTVP